MITLNKRVNIITGHYGSGKSNFAVNLALDLAKKGKRVMLADLDIVNPYFRSADAAALLKSQGVKVAAPVFANTNLDVPALPPEIQEIFDNREITAVLDIGGDGPGAVALGQFHERILAENNFSHFHIMNFKRPLTSTPEEAVNALRECESACGVPVTLLVNNTNLSSGTDSGVVLSSLPLAREAASLCGVPIACTTVETRLAKTLAHLPDIYAVTLHVKPEF